MTKSLVVSDSSSLILITKAGLLSILCKEFEVEIPMKVFEETVIAGKDLQKPSAFQVEKAIHAKDIAVKKLSTIKESSVYPLSGGEKEAVELYFQSEADLLLMDDWSGIRAAKTLNINWTTALGLLMEFVDRKKISRQDGIEALRILQNEGRYKLDFITEAFNEIQNGR